MVEEFQIRVKPEVLFDLYLKIKVLMQKQYARCGYYAGVLMHDSVIFS